MVPIHVGVFGKSKPTFNGGFFFQLSKFLTGFFLLGVWPNLAATLPPKVIVGAYNVENYRITPSERVRAKPVTARDAVADVVAGVQPDILGLCEVASPEALDDLRVRLKSRGLDFPYVEYVDGPDADRHLALLSRFPLVARHSDSKVGFVLNGIPELVRRGFLDVTIQISPKYQIRLIGVHLKSRLASTNGEAELRRMEALLLRERIDQILQTAPSVNLLVYGDFNETKEGPSVRGVLGSRSVLHGLADLPQEDSGGERWTYYRAQTDVYERIDFLMVSRALRPEISLGFEGISSHPQWRRASDHRLLYGSLVPYDK